MKTREPSDLIVEVFAVAVSELVALGLSREEAVLGLLSQAAVQANPGAFAKGTTSLLLDWILLKGYEGEEHLQKFIARNLNSD
mgnify:CR=1 FL=1